MFSSRLDWDLTPNRMTEILAAKRAGGVDVLDLTESNPTRVGLDYDEAGILSALAQPESMLYQPSPRGLLAARRAIADYYRDRGQDIHPDSIFLTASTSEAYAYLFKLLADPGAEMLVPQPSYPLFEFLATLESVQPVGYPLKYAEDRGWQVHLERLSASIGARTAAIVAVNPNNPTGSYLKRHELDAINALCAEQNLALIVDEVFADYGCGEDSDRVRTAVNNEKALTFVLSGLSKVVGLPQVKLGWIQVSGPVSLCSAAQERLEFIADTYLSVATMVQHAAPRLLAQRDMIQGQIIARIEENGRFLEEQCARASNCRVLMREGGWYAVIEVLDALSDEERAYYLLEHDNVLVHPGYFYDFAQEGFLILSLLTPPATFREGVSRIISSATEFSAAYLPGSRLASNQPSTGSG